MSAQGQTKDWWYSCGVGAMIVVLAGYKYRFLSLPYYWDEAWPYSTGVHILYHHGLSLLPGAVPSFIARGHPLMFHFLAAGWMNIFGTGLIQVHAFALFVSILVIISVYLFCKAFFSARVGFIAAILLVTQAVFIAQSAFLMPEMLMALWVMACFHTFFKERYILFIACATAMLLTKESGGVFVIALGCAELIRFFFSKEKQPRPLLRRFAIISAPVALAFVYYLIQKIQCGFFLYPFYMNYMSSQWMKITTDLPNAMAYLFIYNGRNALSLLLIITGLLLLLPAAKKLAPKERQILLSFACFIVLYLIFSSVNYYIPRYLLCCFPPFVIAGALLADRAMPGKTVLLPLIVVGLAVTNVFFYLQPKPNGDMDYSDNVKTDMAIVKYFEEAHLNDSYILAPSVLRIDFCEPYADYISGSPFNHIQSDFSDKTEYCIQTSEEDEKELYVRLKGQHKLALIKRIELGRAWGEIYKVQQ